MAVSWTIMPHLFLNSIRTKNIGNKRNTEKKYAYPHKLTGCNIVFLNTHLSYRVNSNTADAIFLKIYISKSKRSKIEKRLKRSQLSSNSEFYTLSFNINLKTLQYCQNIYKQKLIVLIIIS